MIMEKMATFILIGSVDAGKTSLFNALLGIEEEARKTQALVYDDQNSIDTPGEYFDNPKFYSFLICSMMDIDTIIYVHPCNNNGRKLPHGLFKIYGEKNIIGVITKVDEPDANVDEVRQLMNDYGITEDIFEVSIYDKASVKKLKDYLCERNNKKQDVA